MSKQTVQQWLEEQLVNHGLWPAEAATVLALMQGKPLCMPEEASYDEIKDALDVPKALPSLDAVKFNDPVDSYPKPLFACLLMIAKHQALEWLKEHAPQHFAIAMLTPEPMPVKWPRR